MIESPAGIEHALNFLDGGRFRIPGRTSDMFAALTSALARQPQFAGVTPIDALQETEVAEVSHHNQALAPLVIEYVPAGAQNPTDQEKISVSQPILGLDQKRVFTPEQVARLTKRWNEITQANNLQGVNMWAMGGVGSSVVISADLFINLETSTSEALQSVEDVRRATPLAISALADIS